MSDSVAEQDIADRYLEGIRLFNEEEFFECHDVLEEIWSECQGEEKSFLQGLIQASVALFHFGNENYGGAKKLYVTSLKRLDAYADEYMGIQLARFRDDFRRCFAELMASPEAYPTGMTLQDDLVPKIHFVEPAAP
jgi:predicted metal-dependent hydrolase